jgi:uncharacterized DUF497 family protein
VRFSKLEYDGFDWDEGNIAKIEARIPLQIVEEFFKGKILFKEDDRHSFSEERFIAIRPISARFTHKKEEEAYEKQIKKIQES